MPRMFLLFCLPFLSVVAVPSIWAQEVSEEAETLGTEPVEVEEHSALEPVFRWINFAILFGGLGYLLRKPAGEFFNARLGTIRSGLDRARIAGEEADAQLADIARRSDQLGDETARLREEAAEIARREQDRIVSDARGEVGRAITQSRAEVERLTRGRELEIRAHVADRVIERAAQELERRMTPQEQEKVLRRVARGL